MPTDGHQQQQSQLRARSSVDNNQEDNRAEEEVRINGRRQSAVRTPATAAAAVADPEGVLDLDVVLLQMSQKFNNDLDVRAAATATTAMAPGAAAARSAGKSNNIYF